MDGATAVNLALQAAHYAEAATLIRRAADRTDKLEGVEKIDPFGHRTTIARGLAADLEELVTRNRGALEAAGRNPQSGRLLAQEGTA